MPQNIQAGFMVNESGYIIGTKRRKFFLFKKGKKSAPQELEMYYIPEANANKRGDWVYDVSNGKWYRCVPNYGPSPRKNQWDVMPANQVPATYRAWTLIL